MLFSLIFIRSFIKISLSNENKTQLNIDDAVIEKVKVVSTRPFLLLHMNKNQKYSTQAAPTLV